MSERHLSLAQPMAFAESSACERVYALPPEVVFEPETEYRISGRICQQGADPRVFEFAFSTDARAHPIAY
jgi:hypothetical protein